MSRAREVLVHLLPELVAPERLACGVAVVIDVLRATTTIVHALAAGCCTVRPCADVEEARQLAGQMRAGKVVLAGERDGLPLPGFDAGNSPGEFTAARCRGTTLVLTTTNGTKALLRAAAAARALVAAFVNFSAVCEQLRQEARPIHVLCAGNAGEVALEDTLLAGALIDWLCDGCEVRLNDGARLAWDCFEHHGRVLDGALALSAGGARLRELGYDEDVRAAGRVDQFALVPEVRREPLRVEIGAVGIVKSHWPT
jgi:2-phosphosulfolactate phosphatase